MQCRGMKGLYYQLTRAYLPSIYIYIYIERERDIQCSSIEGFYAQLTGRTYLSWMPADVQMNCSGSAVHLQWFSCQKISADDCDIII